MIDGFALCILALIVCFLLGRVSLGHGISALMVFGYFYGILRANYLDGMSHFIFDMGLLGLYAAQFTKPLTEIRDARSKTAKRWLMVLMGWPILLFVLPIHHYLIQLVGLRHIILLLPALLLGARLRGKDLDLLTRTLAVLNVVTFVFALFEYKYGIDPFFPHNQVTHNMYESHDVKTADGTYHRLPATFLSSHTFAGTMVITAILFLNATLDDRKTLPKRAAMAGVLLISVLGMFMAGARLPVVQIGVMGALMILLPGLRPSMKAALAVCVLAIGIVCAYYVVNDPRLQRFTTLGNVEMVETRASGSLDFSLLESFAKYPLGVGLGGAAGASIPYFLKDLAPEQVGAENEFVRIAVEQGFVGFGLWMTLLLTLAIRSIKPVNPHWKIGTHAMKAAVLTCWGTAFVGTGLLQAIPTSFLLLLQMGLLLRDEASENLPLRQPVREKETRQPIFTPPLQGREH